MLNENFEQVLKIYSLAISDISNILASDVRKYLQGFLKEQRYFGNYTTDEVITSKRVMYYFNPEENCLDLFNTFIFLVTKYKNLDKSIDEIIQKVLKVNETIFANSKFKPINTIFLIPNKFSIIYFLFGKRIITRSTFP